MIFKSARIEGFLVLDFMARAAEIIPKLEQWVLDGSLVHPEEILDGLDNAPVAMNRLSRGENHGMQLIRITGGLTLVGTADPAQTRIVEDWYRALQNVDLEGFAKLHASDCMYNISGHTPISGRCDFQQLAAEVLPQVFGRLDLSQFRFTNLEDRVPRPQAGRRVHGR